jgi:transposase InsO family protein
MAWKDCFVMDQRLEFVLACLDELESMSQLCRRFGITRRIGYKWLARYREQGAAGLSDRSRCALVHGNKVELAIERRLLSLRCDHPTWGPRKLLKLMEKEDESAGLLRRLPAASTVSELLKRSGLIVPHRRRERRAVQTGVTEAGTVAGPNQLWCADFKGWFRTGDGQRCDPLTITDAHSRYLLRCQLSRQTHQATRGLFEATFREMGMPLAMRTDNGEPFAGPGPLGLSRLSIWLLHLGVKHVRGRPGCPQDNGAHERMHRTLKKETASPPAANSTKQQQRMHAFRIEYNQHRPHQALAGMAVPAALYQPSPRRYPERLPELVFPPGCERRRLDDTGKFTWGGIKVHLGQALADEAIGLRCTQQQLPEMDRYWTVYLGSVELGLLDSKKHRLLSEREARHLLKGL